MPYRSCRIQYFVNSWQPFGFPFIGNSLSLGFLTLFSKFRVTGYELLAEASTKLNQGSSFREKRSTCLSLHIPHSDKGCKACPEHNGVSHLGGGTKGKQAGEQSKYLLASPHSVSGEIYDYICIPACASHLPDQLWSWLKEELWTKHRKNRKP